jgi:hypothetical protein
MRCIRCIRGWSDRTAVRKGLTAWQAGAQPFDPALRDLRMNRPAGRFTSSAPTERRRARQRGELFFGAVGAGFWFRWIEAVADPGFGVDVARMAWVGLDFSSQLIDENTQVFGFFPIVRSPDGLQQAAMRLGFARIRNELAQEFEFFRRAADGFVVHHDGALLEVNFQIVGDEGRSGVAGRGSAQSGTDARHEFLDAEGFYDVVIGASIESLDLVAFGIAHGEHDDGRIAGGADFAAGFESGNSG